MGKTYTSKTSKRTSSAESMHLSKFCIPCLAALLLLSALSGCAFDASQPVTKTGLYFDTVISITLYGTDKEACIEECFSMAKTYESYFSNKLPDSDISQINAHPQTPVNVHAETAELLQRGIAYGKLSDGAFDITVGRLSDLWNFGHETFVVPPLEEVAGALATVDYRNIRIEGNQVTLLSENAKIDLGGIAKGYIADKMKEYLNSQGVTEGLINLGGNVLALGPKTSGDSKTYTIALQKPFAADGKAFATVKITDQSVVTSGIYQRCAETDGVLYHHILDTRTGYPCDNELSSVTVISSASTDGDALSTLVFTMGLDVGMEFVEHLADTEAVFITKDETVFYTSGVGKTIPFEVL